jgi:hypothetical protein
MTGLVPDDFDVPRSLATPQFRLEPLGPQHNHADHAAWTSSIDHIRATPGFDGSDWPPPSGMSLEDNLADLQGHADDFVRGRGFTYTVLDAVSDDVIGCVYIYPSRRAGYDVDVRSWVRADRADLDGPLSTAVATWLTAAWPLGRIDRHSR